MDSRVIYPELSYTLTGICFDAHKEVGLYGKEKQYDDIVERELKLKQIPFVREAPIGNTGNRVDFIVDGKKPLELKSKRILTKEDFIQTQRYLQATGLKLGLLINFRDMYVKPKRIVRIDTDGAEKYR